MKCKAFDQILREINFHPGKVKRWLNDKRLSSLEKKIIEGHMLIRNNQNTEAISHLSRLPESDIEFVNAHKNLLLGIGHNNLSRYLEAQNHLDKAVKVLEALELNHYLFVARFNQFVLFTNRNEVNKMKQVLDLMQMMTIDSKHLEIRLLRCQFLYSVESGNVKEARTLIAKISTLKEEMGESDLIAHLVSEFGFHIKNDSFDEAREVLGQMKLHRKFNLSENYNFMKKLLDHLAFDTPVYAYDIDFVAVPVLFHQLKVIQAFEANDLEEARKHWSSLQEVSPGPYLDNFQYSGSKCLFSLCLIKHQVKEVPRLESGELQEGSMAEIFVALISKSEMPVSKSMAYEILWGEPPQDKEDLKRLTRLVSKIRVKNGLDIQTRKGTYFIVHKPKKSKAS